MKEELFPNAVSLLTNRYFNAAPLAITPLGGGFYGRVFLAELSTPSRLVVWKLCIKSGLHRKEAAQLTMLKKHALLKVPSVFLTHDADEEISVDAIAMEFLEGANAGISDIPLENRDRIAGQIVENLASIHRCKHPEGFGELDASSFCPAWKDFYRAKAEENFLKAERLLANFEEYSKVLLVCRRAFKAFDRIFAGPIPEATLIHGDYNTWNILLDPELANAVALIDPFGCHFADSELDLYQLSNANGLALGLLKRYEKTCGLRENFRVKNAYYELFTEIMHFHDANISPAHSRLPAEAEELSAAMDDYGV